MFFGDLGTSRFYVLGLALFYAGLAAPYYVAAICALVIAVGWAYTVICRVQPDGGGVYSSGRMLHPTLGAVGAILLMANYVVTAAISTYVAVIYIGIPLGMARELAPWFTIIAIGLIGALNWVGPKRAGAFALVVALAAIGITFLLAVFTIQHFPEGWRAFTTQAPSVPISRMWQNLVFVVLALSGVESIANMTGIMVQPVKRTSKMAIWPVIGEVVLLNLILVVIVCSLPGLSEVGVIADIADKDPSAVTAHDHELTEHVLEVVAKEYVGFIPGFSAVASIIFGLLLLSATNTAIIAMISIQYAMSRDREMPPLFSRINQFGVPVYGLIVACTLAGLVTAISAGLGEGTLQSLAKLYAIGVVGAIVINLGSCAVNRKLNIKLLERTGMWFLGGILLTIWITIAVTNRPALIFITVMLAAGLTLRFIARRIPVRVPVPAEAVPALAAAAEAPTGELLPFDPDKGRLLVASRRNLKLLRFAFDEARRRAANIFVLYVRDIAVLFPGQAHPMTPEEDIEASALFRHAENLAREYGVPMQPIYSVSRDPAYVILDFSATYAVDLVMLGVSRRAGVLRALRGDVIAGVADNLPTESTLLIHA